MGRMHMRRWRWLRGPEAFISLAIYSGNASIVDCKPAAFNRRGSLVSEAFVPESEPWNCVILFLLFRRRWEECICLIALQARRCRAVASGFKGHFPRPLSAPPLLLGGSQLSPLQLMTHAAGRRAQLQTVTACHSGAATEAPSHRTVVVKGTESCEQRTRRATFAHRVKHAERGVHTKQTYWLTLGACFVIRSIGQQRHQQARLK